MDKTSLLISYQHLIVGKSLSGQKPVLRKNRRQMAEKTLTEKRNVTPEMAIRMFRENGVEIDEKKVAEVLDLLYFLAKLIVNQNFKT